MTPLAYCPTCRVWFVVEENPPYAVMHVPGPDEENPVHLHPLTREVLGEEMNDGSHDDGTSWEHTQPGEDHE